MIGRELLDLLNKEGGYVKLNDAAAMLSGTVSEVEMLCSNALSKICEIREGYVCFIGTKLPIKTDSLKEKSKDSKVKYSSEVEELIEIYLRENKARASLSDLWYYVNKRVSSSKRIRNLKELKEYFDSKDGFTYDDKGHILPKSGLK